MNEAPVANIPIVAPVVVAPVVFVADIAVGTEDPVVAVNEIEVQAELSYDSNDEDFMTAEIIVPFKSNETNVTRLSRHVVKDYIKAKRQVRHFTPDLGSRRVRF